MIFLQMMSLIWVAVWLHLYLGGPRHRTLPVNPQLRIWSTVTFVSIFLFYTTLYTPSNWSVFNTIEITLGGDELLTMLALVISVVGFGLIVIARHALRHLSGMEVFVSMSQTDSRHWIYAYMKHPMYIGIYLVILGSWLLVPTLMALPFAFLALFAVRKKSLIESKHHVGLAKNL